MSYILGIDTGGTYTDGVLLDFNRQEVAAKAKAFTTPQDLSLGIRECIENLEGISPAEIKMVSLSTTLATNAIVEGRGGKVGLILIGYQPSGDFPAHKVCLISGGHNIYGEEKSPLDLEELAAVIAQMKEEVDTVAISSIFSIRNPDHEKRAKELLQRAWNVPVICAHELSSTIGLYERTVTACLNAKLLPIISELLTAVKQVLSQKAINVPIMIVKGDGSLITEETALERPIETILSGPAASVVGAMFLSGLETFMTLDMGGTTTDIGIVKDKWWRMQEEGAIVAGWRTHIHTAEISTFGVGGDSYIQVLAKGQIKIGPVRVIPLCVLSVKYPYLVQELKEVQESKALSRGDAFDGQTLDCWVLIKPPQNPESLGRDEQLIVNALKDGPHNVLTLKYRTEKYISPFALKTLERARIIARASFTPTDVLHCLGLFNRWNIEAAKEGAQVLGNSYGCSGMMFAAECLNQMTKSLSLTILQSIASKQGYSFDLAQDENMNFFLEPFFKTKDKNPDLQMPITLNYPIVSIGAPVQAYMPPVGHLLKTKVLIPEHSEIANAIGAAVGKVTERITVLLRTGFIVHAPWGCERFMCKEDARERILTKGRETVIENAHRAGIKNPEIIVNREEVSIDTEYGPVFIEELFEISASGNCQGENS